MPVFVSIVNKFRHFEYNLLNDAFTLQIDTVPSNRHMNRETLTTAFLENKGLSVASIHT